MQAELLDSLLAGVPDATDAGRARALAALRRDGLPGPRSEAWKYTSLRALAQRTYGDGDPQALEREVEASTFAVPGIDGARMVFVNGRFRADLSVMPAQQGVELRPFSAEPGALAELLAGSEGDANQADAFARLNAVLVRDGAWLRVAAGVAAPPLHLVFVGAPAAADLAWQGRILVELAEGASLRLVEHHVGGGANAHLGNVVAEHRLAAGASLDWVQLQVADAGSVLLRDTHVTLQRDARLAVHAIETGAALARHHLRVDLAGPGAQLDARGAFVLQGRQHADIRFDVRHVARDAGFDIDWRGVADGRSRGVFHGAITIQPGADGADAKLSNRNLLLSAQAEIDTQPVLEIHADEVKAAHGATVGQLDEHALFYLRSRGIPFDAARRILVAAFCDAAFARLDPPVLRERIARHVASRLPETPA